MLYIFFLAGYLTGMTLTFWMLEFDTVCRWWNKLINLFKREKWTLPIHFEKMHDFASKISKAPAAAGGTVGGDPELDEHVSLRGDAAQGRYRRRKELERQAHEKFHHELDRRFPDEDEDE